MLGKEINVLDVKNYNKVYVVPTGKRPEICKVYTSEITGHTYTTDLVVGSEYRKVNAALEDVKYYEIVKGVEMEVTEPTFDTIRLAVARCKAKNDESKVRGAELFPGIDEALEVLNAIAKGRKEVVHYGH